MALRQIALTASYCSPVAPVAIESLSPMSEPTFSSLAIMHKHWLTNCYGEEVGQLLTGERIAKHPDQSGLHSPYYRYLSIVTENGWFHSKVKALQLLSGIGGLAYLGEGSSTHEHRQVTTDNAGKVVWVETHGYTVLSSGWEGEIAAIRGLEEWCREHPAEAADVLEVSTKWLFPAIDSQFFTLDPGNEGLGDGNSPEYFFCVLRTISEMMRFAKFHKETPNLWVVYHTVLRYGS